MTDLLEPDAVKAACPVLRGEECRDAFLLPDWLVGEGERVPGTLMR